MLTLESVSICAIARYENAYIKEWVDYHLSLGFTHIYLYDNNREGEERISSVINAKSGYAETVTIIPYHQYDNDQYPQMRAYGDCYYRNVYDWIAFIDIDEFVTFSKKSGIKSIGELCRECRDFDAILLNWMTFGDNGKIHYEAKPVLQRFVKPLPYRFSQFNLWGKNPVNGHVKSIIKKGLEFQVNGPHVFYGPLKCCNADAVPVENMAYQQNFTFKTAYIRHFVTKSFEEFVNSKMKRQAADQAKNVYYLMAYFEYNKPTFAKYLAYKKALPLFANQPNLPLKWWLKSIVKFWVIMPFLYLRDKKLK